jgi:hypothetical protein
MLGELGGEELILSDDEEELGREKSQLGFGFGSNAGKLTLE